MSTRSDELDASMLDRLSPKMTGDIAGAVQLMAEGGDATFSGIAGVMAMIMPAAWAQSVEGPIAGKALVRLSAKWFGQKATEKPWSTVSE